MSLEASAWAKRERVGKGKAGAKVVLMVLADYANDRWESWPKMKTLLFEAEQDRRTVQRNLRYLEDQGFIKTEARLAGSGRQTSNIYRLNPELAEGRQIAAPTPEGDPKQGRQIAAGRAAPTPPSGAAPTPPLEPSEELPLEQLRATTTADEGFREWLGPELVAAVQPWLGRYGITDTQLAELMRLVGPSGFARGIWLDTPKAEWPRIFATAASDYVAQEVALYGPSRFRFFLSRSAKDFLRLQERGAARAEERSERERRAVVRPSAGPTAVGELLHPKPDDGAEAMDLQLEEELRWVDELGPEDAARFQLWVNTQLDRHTHGHLAITRQTLLLESIRKARKHGLIEAIRGVPA